MTQTLVVGYVVALDLADMGMLSKSSGGSKLRGSWTFFILLCQIYTQVSQFLIRFYVLTLANSSLMASFKAFVTLMKVNIVSGES